MSAIKNIGPIPQLGFGSFKLLDADGRRNVEDALEVGYRHIDTAEMYGNEKEVGEAIKHSGLKRSDIFLTTKVAPENFGPGQVLVHAKMSLEKLQVDQVDLLLLHWPSMQDQYDAHDYVAQLAEVQDKGLCKHIGVSNFTKKYIDITLKVLGARPIVTNQCEIHVLLQNRPIVDYCKTKNIPMTAYSPLARGALTTNPTLAEIGKKSGHSANQAALAFLMAEGHIIIPSSSKKARMTENFGAKDVVLEAADIAAIRKLDEGRRLINGAWCPVWDT